MTVRAAIKLADTNNANLTVLDVLVALPAWRKKEGISLDRLDALPSIGSCRQRA